MRETFTCQNLLFGRDWHEVIAADLTLRGLQERPFVLSPVQEDGHRGCQPFGPPVFEEGRQVPFFQPEENKHGE